ncbi:ligand-binding sensor domain-containing protein [Pustulibacterium marinum]|nr:two-component regulator propeller domain-containing protein [Pustulibacterium marinum]
MKRNIHLMYLLLMLVLNISCAKNKGKLQESKAPEFSGSIQTDTLTFTSGIRAIFQDSKGNYWFGSLQEGVAVYNGHTFTYFTNTDGLSDNQVLAIREDKEGVIWFDTQMGVSSYDGSSITNQTDAAIVTSQNMVPMQGNESFQEEWMKSKNDLWFGAGVKEGVYRFDGQELQYLAFPPHKVLNPNDNLFAVTSISEGKHNRIWFGTYAGVFGYNDSTFTVINDATLGFDRTIAPLHIRSILEDSKGRLWIGNNGIGVLLKEGDSIINFSEKNNLIHPTSERKGDASLPGTLEHVFTIAEDSKGTIWFGDRDAGIWKYDGVKMTNYTKKYGLTNDTALAIFEDAHGKLWFGMQDGNVYIFNGNTFEKQF